MITHKTGWTIRYGNAEDERYLCNQACNVTESKVRYVWKYVTCKNCLRLKNG